MKKILTIIALGLVFCGCSSDDNEPTIIVNTLPPAQPDQHFNLTVNGTEVELNNLNMNDMRFGSISRNSDSYSIFAKCGIGDSPESTEISLRFDLNGKLVSATQKSVRLADQVTRIYYYRNYKNFPSNYFNISIVSVDEANKKIKLTFEGDLYMQNGSLPISFDSAKTSISGDLEMVYNQSEGNSDFSLNGVPQYCNAKFNAVEWRAWAEPQNSIFTSTDAYRIETHFAISTTPGSYAINESSGNYVRFSKFNTATLTYDYYNVTGTIAHSYREFHGAASYSYIGTFNFTAVNPNNPSDVIQVTDGSFRSYQKF